MSEAPAMVRPSRPHDPLATTEQRACVVLLKVILTLIVMVPVCESGSPAMLHAGDMMKMADLIAHPDQYDKQVVTVIGEVSDLQTATTRKGKSAYGFLLKSNGGTVKVIGLGETSVLEGEQVVVEGVFNRFRRSGRASVFNEIKAELVRPLSRLTPEFVG